MEMQVSLPPKKKAEIVLALAFLEPLPLPKANHPLVVSNADIAGKRPAQPYLQCSPKHPISARAGTFADNGHARQANSAAVVMLETGAP